jgi:hypothetical protein
MAISRRLRFEVLRRDGYTCRYCGAKAPDVVLTVDHVIPVTLGGGDDPRNLVAACQDCNAGKSSVPIDAPVVEDVDATAMLVAAAFEQASEKRRQELSDIDEIQVRFYHAWVDMHGYASNTYLPLDWRMAIARFLHRGLTYEDLEHFIPVPMRADIQRPRRFNYFCGCCWNELTEREELARRLLEDGEV